MWKMHANDIGARERHVDELPPAGAAARPSEPARTTALAASRRPWWRQPRVMLSYGVAVVSVSVAVGIARWLEIHLASAPASLFLCAIVLSAWFGGLSPGLFAVVLALLAFDFYFALPLHSLAMEAREVPGFVVFALSAMFVASLTAAQRTATESLRYARDDLSRTVHELRSVNDHVQAENAEGKRAEQTLDASVRHLRAIGGRLLHAQDDERRRIARLLHETIAQDLAALKMVLARVSRTADCLDDGQRNALAESMSLAEQTTTEIRSLSHLLHPPFLDEAGLLSALRWYAVGFAERSGIKVDLDLPESFERLPIDTETALFRIAQESLINVHRHAGSETARICLRCDGETLSMEIEDRGHGIPQASLQRISSGGAFGGAGIALMNERIEQLGGRLEVSSNDRGTTGTAVRAFLPLAKDAR